MPHTAGSDQSLVQFLLPGLLHNLRNSLFAIQGHAQSLGSESPDLEAEKAAILRGSDQAQGALEVLGMLAGQRAGQPVQSGILLHRLGDILRVPLRESGLRLDLQHSSRQTPEPVDGTVLCRGLTATLQAFLEALPSGYRGELCIDLAFQCSQHLDLHVQARGDTAQLPFPVHLDDLVLHLAPRLLDQGALLSLREGEPGLRLRIPTLSPQS